MAAAAHGLTTQDGTTPLPARLASRALVGNKHLVIGDRTLVRPNQRGVITLRDFAKAMQRHLPCDGSWACEYGLDGGIELVGEDDHTVWINVGLGH